METLDKCFENVCELDLIFHMDKVSGEPLWDRLGMLLSSKNGSEKFSRSRIYGATFFVFTHSIKSLR